MLARRADPEVGGHYESPSQDQVGLNLGNKWDITQNEGRGRKVAEVGEIRRGW